MKTEVRHHVSGRGVLTQLLLTVNGKMSTALMNVLLAIAGNVTYFIYITLHYWELKCENKIGYNATVFTLCINLIYFVTSRDVFSSWVASNNSNQIQNFSAVK